VLEHVKSRQKRYWRSYKTGKLYREP